MARTYSFRTSLLWNLVLIIILLSGAILLTTFMSASRKLAELSGSMTNQTLDQTESRLDEFFQPVMQGLQIARVWGQAGVLDIDDPDAMNDLFVPLMNRCPQVSSLLIANEHGGELMLLRTAEGWQNRLTPPDGATARIVIRTWTDAQPEPASEPVELDYDPRRRPWFIGAMALREQQQETLAVGEVDSAGLMHWTKPYTFFTTKEPGITASVSYETVDGVVWIIGFDVLLRDISEFTTRLRVGEHGKVVILTDGQVIGLPRDPYYEDEAHRAADLLKPPDQIATRLAADATAAFASHAPDHRGPIHFRSGGQQWWGAWREYALSADRMLITAVVVPRADLIGDLSRVRVPIVIITLVFIGLATWQAHRLARRYGEPMQQLAEESDRISRLDLEGGKLIESEISEVNRLAHAQERMRGSLQALLKLERDLQLARQIQQSTFPEQLPRVRGFEIDAVSSPAEETGGDTYDVVGLRIADAGEPIMLSAGDADHVVLLLADATGHGVGPALSVTQVRAMLRMAVRINEPLASIARHMNDQLRADLPTGRFITAWMGELSAADRTLTSLSAGQGPLLWFSAERRLVKVIETDCPPLGILDDLEVPRTEPIRLDPGDVFAVISDGFFEAMNREGAQFGVDRVIEVIQRHQRDSARRILAALRDAVEQFAGGEPAGDDRTVIVIKRTSRR
jgi:serine phosphatase RsbU (regulator of sigma subunit)